MDGASRDDYQFVFGPPRKHQRFLGIAPAPKYAQQSSGPTIYVGRIVDKAGHEMTVSAPLVDIVRLVADALRKTERP